MRCSIKKCRGLAGKGQKLYRIPKKETSVIWVEYLKKFGVNEITESTRLCDLHFEFADDGNGLKRADIPSKDEDEWDQVIDIICFAFKIAIFAILI